MTAGGLDGTKIFEALECFSQHSGLCVVVKYGGHAMTNDERASEFARDVALLQSLGVRPVVVHGGGPQINAMLERLEVQSEFVNGLRADNNHGGAAVLLQEQPDYKESSRRHFGRSLRFHHPLHNAIDAKRDDDQLS